MTASRRDTATGDVLEEMILPALRRGGYSIRPQTDIGTRPGGGRHRVDAIAEKGGVAVPISLKGQEVSGTAEQKVPFGVISLAERVKAGVFGRAYLVLGGPGWTVRDYYTSGALREHLVHADLVRIVALEAFIKLANRGQL